MFFTDMKNDVFNKKISVNQAFSLHFQGFIIELKRTEVIIK